MDAPPRRRRGLMAPSLALACLLPLPACRRGPDVNPPAEAARVALVAALDAWRGGKRPDTLASASPRVQVMDTEWRNGRKLADYEVLREEPAAADKRFAVRLGFANPKAEAETTYIVIGADPVMVFREDDYARGMNMDNNPTARKKR